MLIELGVLAGWITFTHAKFGKDAAINTVVAIVPTAGPFFIWGGGGHPTLYNKCPHVVKSLSQPKK